MSENQKEYKITLESDNNGPYFSIPETVLKEFGFEPGEAVLICYTLENGQLVTKFYKDTPENRQIKDEAEITENVISLLDSISKLSRNEQKILGQLLEMKLKKAES